MEKEDISSQNLRRSSRLKGKPRKGQPKGPHFIDLGGETPEQPPAIPPGCNPHHTPYPQPNFEISPSQPDFRDNRRKTTPEIDPTQQEMCDYIESLEKTATDQGTSSAQPNIAQEALIQSLKQDVFVLKVLNRHIKRENETLKE